jgi:hypothetical protein
MNLNTLAMRAPQLLRSPTSRILISPPGMGKSEFIEGLAPTMSALDNVEWGFARIFAPTTNPMDLMGVIRLADREFDGVPTSVSEYAIPPWFRCVDEHGRDGMGPPVTKYERGVLVIEEYGQGEVETKRLLANLFLYKQVGPWKLPAGWRVWATTNRASDRSGVTKDFDHVINRRNELHISPDLKSLMDWMWRSDIHPDIISFTDQNSGTVFGEQPEKQGPFCTPRSLILCERDLKAMSTDGFTLPVDSDATEIASGTIGQGAAAQLMSHLRLAIDLPSIEEIVKNPSGTKVPTKADAHMLVAFRLAALVKKETAEPIIEYMQRLPKEFAVPFAKTAVHREKSLMTTKAFHNWCVKNASLDGSVAGCQIT